MGHIKLASGALLDTVDDIHDIEALAGPVGDGARRKDIGRIDHNFARFIERSPFMLLGTASADGRGDVSPRGDLPGFVHVLDERHLAIPERPGNRRMDSIHNILETGRAGLLFLIPGSDDTVRVNGRAAVTRAAALLASMAVDGRPPALAIVVTVEEAYLHCAKAFRRSRLWDPAARIDRSELPSAGCMLQEQLALDQPGEQVDAYLEAGYTKTMW